MNFRPLIPCMFIKTFRQTHSHEALTLQADTKTHFSTASLVLCILREWHSWHVHSIRCGS